VPSTCHPPTGEARPSAARGCRRRCRATFAAQVHWTESTPDAINAPIVFRGIDLRSVCLVLVALWLVLIAAAGAFAQDTPPVEHYRLDNGLEVLLAPDSKVPKVGMALVYRVGGMNEPAAGPALPTSSST